MAGIEDFESALRAAWPPESWQDLTVILAVSGGADSAALLRAAERIKAAGSGQLVVGHFNHGLRPAADCDERFVVELCEEFSIPCEIGRGDVAAAAVDEGDGIESAARDARYKFLLAIAERHGARIVATAHTAEDQAETILHHIIRGTGLKGLSGMPRNRQLSSAVSLVRPMLAIRRAKVVEYLSQIGQSYRDDESNQDVRFARNRLRHELLPLVRAGYSSDIDNSLLRLGNLAYDAQQVIGQLVESRVADAVSLEKRIAVIECGRLRGDSAYVVREVLIEVWRTMEWPLQSMGFEQWQSLSAIMDTDSDAHLSLPGNVRAQKKDGQLELSRPSID